MKKVIRRPRFKRSEEIVGAILQAIRDKGFWVRPTQPVRACTDPDDDTFLECAQAAKADYLVTGNVRHFPPSLQECRIVTPRWLLDSLAGRMPENTG